MTKPRTCPLIELQHIGLDAEQTPILIDASWRLDHGEHWAILGNNGSGKTSLLRIATGYLRPNRGGRVLWMGIERPDLRDLRRHIGWVSFALGPEVPRRETVLQLVVSGRHAQLGLRPPIRQTPTEEEFAAARRLLDQAQSRHLEDRRFCQLSQGEQQKVLLARALMALPLIIVLDEPCSGLDPGAREQFLDQLAAALEQPDPPTLVMVTHHVEEIIPVIDNVLVMEAGKIRQQGKKADIITPETIADIYGKRPVRIERQQGRLWPIW